MAQGDFGIPFVTQGMLRSRNTSGVESYARWHRVAAIVTAAGFIASMSAIAAPQSNIDDAIPVLSPEDAEVFVQD